MKPNNYLYFIILGLMLVGFVIAVMAYFGGLKESANVFPSFGKMFRIE